MPEWQNRLNTKIADVKEPFVDTRDGKILSGKLFSTLLVNILAKNRLLTEQSETRQHATSAGKIYHTHTSDSVPTGLSMLPYPENIDKAVVISLLSCIRAEIYVLSFLLPVTDRHLPFPTYPDVGQYFH